MRVLLLSHAFNSLTQRVHVELRAAGHEVSLELDIHDDVTREAVALFDPALIVCPFLKRAVPEDVWRACRTFIIHPGIVGDRGPSALDWAILDGEPDWGVTVIEATAEMDAGPVWGHAAFPMRAAAKGSLYRHEVTRAAVAALAAAMARLAAGLGPLVAAPAAAPARGRARPPCRRADRAIDWAADTSSTVLRKIRSADGTPGAPLRLAGRDWLAHDAHPAPDPPPGAAPGAVLARSGPAVMVATRDGAVLIGHLRALASGAAGLSPAGLKLPAVSLCPGAAALAEVAGYPAIRYSEAGDVGFLEFPFYNGAMATDDCRRLRDAVLAARARPTRVLVLTGGPDNWSNGLHLGVIEASASPADESMRNIEAMDDLCLALLTTTDRLVVAALRGNAGAGGVFLALCADTVWLGRDVVLNPHYKDMGNLYGSEYWTYVLPRRLGAAAAAALARARLPMGAAEAVACGLADRVLDTADAIGPFARALAASPDLDARVAAKAACRAADEAARPLAAYRDAELAAMRRNFYGFDPSYHVARHHFIHKTPKARTPLHLAVHRAPARARPATAGEGA